LELAVDLAFDEDSGDESASGVLVKGCALLMVLSSVDRRVRQLDVRMGSAETARMNNRPRLWLRW
jgi:hypothetical protein